MNAETRICQNCKAAFTIEPDDFAFYKKIAVPPPTWCPPCRSMRRLAWREEKTLYRGECALCKKATISIHAPNGPFTVYCRDCWISEKWDPMAYGKDYDFAQPFFTQYRKLMESVPRPALTGKSLVDSEYSHACRNCKRCYMTFWCYFSESSQYSFALLLSRDTYDSYITDNSDHAYECLHSNRLYRTRFAYFADGCLDSAFLFDCTGCSDCFGCVNLCNKKYCLFNKQLSKDEYAAAIVYWDLGSYERLEEAKRKFRDLYLAAPHRFAHVMNSVNVSGDIIRNSKDCQVCFSALNDIERCRYIYFGGLSMKDSQDINAGGDLSELLYDSSYITRAQRCFWSVGVDNAKNVRYSDWVGRSSDVFGCIGVKDQRYCILNKQYSRKEYESLIPRIVDHMNRMPYIDAQGRAYGYGEFFPTELSAYAYNESYAFPWYPKSKTDVLREGWRWQDPPERAYQITKQPENLPDHVKDIGNDILQEVIGCMHRGTCEDQCAQAFRLTAEELAFYRDMNIAVPRLCPSCRHAERFRWRNGFQLYHRRCMCISTVAHSHGTGPCLNEFETTYAPDRPEIIYCDQCYKAEFL